MVQCDGTYDGCFYYAVKTTKIFCRPSCRSKTPKEENVEYFFHIEDALCSNYRPCKRCRPDLLQANYEPTQEVVDQVQQLLESKYDQSWTLEKISNHVGISACHLQRLFKNKTGLSPRQYLNQIRIQRAEQLLLNGEMNNVEICYAVGFREPNQFYAAFRKETGSSPLNFKRSQY
ncbi:bifunctional transcriptional activator/DNA repair enzyme AdaA [Marininema mesophilum]|uniref:bifunctional transcriptional activator/DNA repair enzyme AdaA n=1 Tax=Marininema mesophilum TaxID=1048340 RepID=UPI001FE12431|nr:Ada metal-binding domain-containing protein [Marininema mesophilum]